MNLFILLFSLLAWAGPVQDLAQAADSDLPEESRKAAFERLVAAGGTDIGVVTRVAVDDEEDTRKRWVAIRALGQIRGDRAREILVALTENPEPAIRTAAVQAIGDIGDGTMSPTLIAKLEDPAVIVRAGAAEALCKVGDRSAIAPLDKALRSRENFYRGSSLWVRKHFVATLGCIGGSEAIPVLLRAIQDADAGVQASAVLAFRQVAGFSYGEGRSPKKELAAWKRWAADQLR
jgi:HEAT repeat protein